LVTVATTVVDGAGNLRFYRVCAGEGSPFPGSGANPRRTVVTGGQREDGEPIMGETIWIEAEDGHRLSAYRAPAMGERLGG
jgi:hypothetical protein